MCDMPIKKEWERTGEEEEGPAVEVEIYSGIEFTRLHKGPILPLLSFSVLKNTWCKLTLASRNSKRRKERGEEEQGSRHERRKFQGLLWGLRNVYTLYHRTCSLTKSLKKKKSTSPQASFSRGSPAAALLSYTDPLTFVHVLQLDLLLTLSVLHLCACWFNAKQLAHTCLPSDQESGI